MPGWYVAALARRPSFQARGATIGSLSELLGRPFCMPTQPAAPPFRSAVRLQLRCPPQSRRWRSEPSYVWVALADFPNARWDSKGGSGGRRRTRPARLRSPSVPHRRLRKAPVSREKAGRAPKSGVLWAQITAAVRGRCCGAGHRPRGPAAKIDSWGTPPATSAASSTIDASGYERPQSNIHTDSGCSQAD
jgi:hypothetical protein